MSRPRQAVAFEAGAGHEVVGPPAGSPSRDWDVQACCRPSPSRCYDDAIMMVRSQITLDRETQRRARERASHLGVSLAEYIRRLVARDLGEAPRTTDASVIFALGNSGGGDIASHKDEMIGEAFSAEYEHERGKGRSEGNG